uniref:NACHT domain-containing protein n=1 Tax=Macrostomum lignano TaxID=282301 RepID=A0A1I8JG23_9PLAT
VNKVKTFCGQEEQLARLRRYLLDEPGVAKRPLFVRGLSGMGKTSLLAQCVAMTTEQWCPPSEGVSVVFRYLGTSAMSYHIGDLLLSLLDQLQLLYGLPAAVGVLLLLLDSLDQLSPRDGAYSLAWLPRICPPGIRLVFSSVPAAEIRFPPDCELLELVAAMPRDTALAALRKKLQRRNRRLQDSQERHLLDLFGMCPKPIYLKVLMREALTWTSFTEPRLPVGQPGDDCVQVLVKHVFEGLEN